MIAKINNELPIDFFFSYLQFFLRLKDKFQINWVYYAISVHLVLKMLFKCYLTTSLLVVMPPLGSTCKPQLPAD